MGGNAFAHAISTTSLTLHTPRMTPEKYAELKLLYEAKLRNCLPERKVNILKEAPEKTSYGDLDFIVESADESVDWHSLANQLGAAGLVVHSHGKTQSCSLAVPMDGSASPDFTIYKIEKDVNNVSENTTDTEYAQIDFEVVPKELFEWHSFYASYGDMSGLVGHMVHNLGFTACDKGLMLRLAALDEVWDVAHLNVAQASGRLFLSRDPLQVLHFLGLSVDEYHKGFTTIEGFYQWLGQCSLLSKDSVKIRKDDASTRKKERARPLYHDFFNTWLPAHFGIDTDNPEEPENTPSCSKLTRSSRRQELQEKAVKFFDKQAEYEQMNSALVRNIQCQTADHLVRPIIAEHSGLRKEKVNEVLRGFRRWVGYQDGIPYILSSPHEDAQSQLYKFLGEDKQSLQNEALVSLWVKENWEAVKAVERERGKMAKLPA